MVIECASRPERDACLSVVCDLSRKKEKKTQHEKMQGARCTIVIHNSRLVIHEGGPRTRVHTKTFPADGRGRLFRTQGHSAGPGGGKTRIAVLEE